jgi:hypothetical protein
MPDYLIPQTDAEWLPIIDALQTYTRQLAQGKQWFRGKQTEVYLKGKEINDYVYEAIGRLLQHPEKFDAAKGSLIEYLQLNLIRGLVANDIRNAENKTSAEVFGKADQLAEANDYDQVMKFLEEKVKDDPDVEKLFYGFSLGMKRESILEEFNMSERDYMNAYRRYKTVKKQAITQFDLKR